MVFDGRGIAFFVNKFPFSLYLYHRRLDMAHLNVFLLWASVLVINIAVICRMYVIWFQHHIEIDVLDELIGRFLSHFQNPNSFGELQPMAKGISVV